MFHHRKWFLLGIFLLFGTFSTAAAQTAERIYLSPPNTVDFPTIRAYLKAFNANGTFIHDLQPGDVTVIEDNKSIVVKELEKQEVGTQFLVAVNQGPSFAIRDSNGVSRYDTLYNALSTWAESHSATLDDLSFLSNGGVESLHLSTGKAWLQAFQAFESDFRAATPSLDVLIRAVEVASEPQDQIGKGRAILLLTPPPELPSAGTLQSIFSMAENENIRIYVWMVSSTDAFSSQGAKQLADLAQQTGGAFFAFSGTETLPEVDLYLNPLRYLYALSYESEIRNSEPHQVYAQIKLNNEQVESEVHDFDLQILPPNPIFISPPLEIDRTNNASLSESLAEIDEYTPESQKLEILVEFPDGRPRPLVRTTLFGDGTVLDERNSPPFDIFTWDLKPYVKSGTHVLQVEVVDSFGLRSSSIEQTFRINVRQSPQKIISTLVDNAPIIAGSTAALAGGILLLVLIVNGYIHPRTFGKRRKKTNNKEKYQPEAAIVVKENPAGKRKLSRRRLSNWANRMSWSQQHSRLGRKHQASKVIAHLEYMEKNGQKRNHEPIPIVVGETTFGTDSSKATVVLDDNAVCDLHARLVVRGDGTCILFDEGSIAGTWLNFNQVSSEGERVKHGDIIHIGRVGYCYKITNKDLIPKPIVLPLETLE